MNRLVRFGIIGFLALGGIGSLGFYIAVNHVLPYSSIRPHRITREEIASIFPNGVNPGVLGMKFSALDVTVEDSIQLKGWFVFARRDSALGTIILLHGIASCKETMIQFADTLTKLGYNCILYDSRAHGESGGINCTFGYYEKRDVSAYIDAAIKKHQLAEPFGVYGVSLGAAVAIQAMAMDQRIRSGVVVSPFATLREEIYDFWVHLSHLPIHAIPDGALLHSEQIAHFSVDSVKPEESAIQIKNPVLVIHGAEDGKISVKYGERVFRNLQSPDKSMIVVQGAGHDDIEKVAGASYTRSIIEFFHIHLKN